MGQADGRWGGGGAAREALTKLLRWDRVTVCLALAWKVGIDLAFELDSDGVRGYGVRGAARLRLASHRKGARTFVSKHYTMVSQQRTGF